MTCSTTTCVVSALLVLVGISFANWVSASTSIPDIKTFKVCQKEGGEEMNNKVRDHIVPFVYWGQLAVMLYFVCVFLHHAVRGSNGSLAESGMQIHGATKFFAAVAFIVVLAGYVLLYKSGTVRDEAECTSNTDPTVEEVAISNVFKSQMGTSATMLSIVFFTVLFV